VTFLTAATANAVLGGATTSATIGIAELLSQAVVVLWLSFTADSPSSWNVVPFLGASGAAAGSVVSVSQIANTSQMPSFAANRLIAGEHVWRLTIAAAAGGWAVTSTSLYVSQRFSIYVSVLCVNGGRATQNVYGVVVTAVGEQPPYSGVYSVTVTFGQSMAQIASGTVVPTSLSTMRALARLASCGTTNSGADTSYGIVSVLLPVVEPLNLSPNAEVIALNVIFCVIVGAFLAVCAASVYAFLCRRVALADVLANFHLPSLIAPSAMFAFPTVLGFSIAVVAQPDDDVSLAVAVLGLVISAVWVAWVTLATVVVGPRRVIAVRLPSTTAPKLPPLNQIGELCRWTVQSVAHANRATYSWKGLSGDHVQRNVRWKHSYHILTQDVRFLLVPVAEAVCTTVATVATALVVVPGIGCRFVASLIVGFYLAQTLVFVWLRPYTSTMMQVFSAVTNVLTVLAAVGLMVNIFEWELVYSMRASVAFQVMLLGVSVSKGLIDAAEFVEGSRRLWRWIVVQHDARMDSVECAQLTVHYHEDDAASDDGRGDAMMLSLTEGPPRTPLLLLKSGTSLSNVRQIVADEDPLVSTPTVVDGVVKLSSSFGAKDACVDDDVIHKQLRDRSSAADPRHVDSAKFEGFTVFLMDQSLDDFAEIPIGDNLSRHSATIDFSLKSSAVVTSEAHELTETDDGFL
jgi:hypothetical protein